MKKQCTRYLVKKMTTKKTLPSLFINCYWDVEAGCNIYQVRVAGEDSDIFWNDIERFKSNRTRSSDFPWVYICFFDGADEEAFNVEWEINQDQTSPPCPTYYRPYDFDDYRWNQETKQFVLIKPKSNGFNVHDEILAVLSAEITAEIDNQMIGEMLAQAALRKIE